ncbi:MAG: hypothetical protein ACERKD_12750 [Prolixibacteraceae bacterium]
MSRTIRDLVNTPFKKAMFVVQLFSYVLIPGSPLIGAWLGSQFETSKPQTAGLIVAVFILGEVLFYGSLFFLGKELLLILKEKVQKWWSRIKVSK